MLSGSQEPEKSKSRTNRIQKIRNRISYIGMFLLQNKFQEKFFEIKNPSIDSAAWFMPKKRKFDFKMQKLIFVSRFVHLDYALLGHEPCS